MYKTNTETILQVTVTCIAKFCLLLLFFFIGKRLLGFWLVTFHERGACEHPKNDLAKM